MLRINRLGGMFMLPATAPPGSSRENKTGSWRSFKPRVDAKKCVKCGVCQQNCPEPCITGVEAEKKPQERTTPKIDYDYCKGCGACAANCPVRAIAMEEEEK